MRLASVAPFAGAWIEIRRLHLDSAWHQKSLPSRERGLKYRPRRVSICAPTVAPFAGAWIEMPRSCCLSPAYPSLPSRERGLKFDDA